jgi:DNA-binding IclR family transcriptional regulator
MVAPFARALLLLSVFTPQDPWLCIRELAARTDLPASTVARIAQTLVLLGFLRQSPEGRRYRLGAPVLALGYGATANYVQCSARMQQFAEQHRVHVTLSTRDRLDLVVLESCRSLQAAPALNPPVGVRSGMASSPVGWALLAALPDLERCYLVEHMERRDPRGWPLLRRRFCEATAQVQQSGFCFSLGDCERELAVVAAPVLAEGQAPLVAACIGSAVQMTRARIERELGPRLLTLARSIQESGTCA